MTQRRLIYALYVILLATPEFLARISPRDGLEGILRAFSGGGAFISVLFLIMFARLFIDGLRGYRGSFNVLAGIWGVIGAACLIVSLSAPNGPFQLAAAGMTYVALCLLTLILRNDVQARLRERREMLSPARRDD